MGPISKPLTKNVFKSGNLHFNFERFLNKGFQIWFHIQRKHWPLPSSRIPSQFSKLFSLVTINSSVWHLFSPEVQEYWKTILNKVKQKTDVLYGSENFQQRQIHPIILSIQPRCTPVQQTNKRTMLQHSIETQFCFCNTSACNTWPVPSSI